LGAIFAKTTHAFFSSPMSSAVYGKDVHVKILGYPYYWSTELALSITTMIIGIVLFLNAKRVREVTQRALDLVGWGMDKGFDQFMSALLRFAHSATTTLQRGRLEFYLTITFLILAVCLLMPLLGANELPLIPEFAHMPFHVWAIIALAVVGLVAIVLAKNRLIAIISLGIQGFAVALIFLLFGAPDLSFTQFMVETLSVVILALVMIKLNLEPSDHRSKTQKMIDGSIAIGCGLGFALVLMAATQTVFDASLSQFFSEYSRAIAHGRNIVNVIIVDFRGTDTLGEIAVVLVTGLAIHALIRIKASKVQSVEGNLPNAPKIAAPKAASPKKSAPKKAAAKTSKKGAK